MEQGFVLVEGFAQVQRAFALAEKDVRLGVRKELRQVAEPVRVTIEDRAATQIRNMRKSLPWSRMRVGVTRNLVYVAPRQRGVKGRGYDPRRRGQAWVDPPDFGTLMMTRAMEPALAQHGPQIERDVERFIDQVADKFNRGA